MHLEPHPHINIAPLPVARAPKGAWPQAPKASICNKAEMRGHGRVVGAVGYLVALSLAQLKN